MIKLKELLTKGMFPSQVPPCFSSKLFGEKHHALTLKFKNMNLTSAKCRSIRPETYSVARIGHSRRQTGIVNPIPQFYLSRLISNNWSKLTKHYKKSSMSLSIPTLDSTSTRAITFTEIKVLQEKKLIDSTGYKYVLISDISQFFPTIYTHAIGWALDGKEAAKIKQYDKRSYPNDLGIMLDRKIGHCQSSQTIGIPIGPDTSHILAEIIGVSIDMQLVSRLGAQPAGFRYVDDYYLFFDTKGAAEDALTKLTLSMSHLELKINAIKTKIIETSELSEETWKYALQQFKFESSLKGQKNSINYYFDLAFKTAKNHQDENVMVYAIKRLKGLIVKKSNWLIYESYLCKVLLSFPNAIQDVSQILYTYHIYNYIEKKENISRTINQLILEHALLDHHSETVWGLWLANELKVKIKTPVCLAINNSTSSMCLILAYDMQLNGLLESNLDIDIFKDWLEPNELWRTNWLLSYEAGIRGWMGTSPSGIDADIFFGELNKYKITFYTPETKIEPTFKPKLLSLQETIDRMSLEEFDEDEFEFLQETEDYTDMRSGPLGDFINYDEHDIEDNDSSTDVSLDDIDYIDF